MNENIDLTKILKGYPKGTKLYSPFIGDVEFDSIVGKFIYVTTMYGNLEAFDKKGIYGHYDGECMLLPSKDQRDWSKFERFWDKPKIERIDVNTFQPFDKILARNSDRENWTIEYYSYGKEVSFGNEDKYIQGLVYSWKYVIPYNEDTKHLIGTDNDCPEYYKWWEE